MGSTPDPAEPAGLLEITGEDRGHVRLLTLSGEIDLSTADVLRRAADGHGGPLVLDVGGVSFVDSTGVRTLMEISAERTVALHDTPTALRRMLELTQLTERFPAVEGLEQRHLDDLA